MGSSFILLVAIRILIFEGDIASNKAVVHREFLDANNNLRIDICSDLANDNTYIDI